VKCDKEKVRTANEFMLRDWCEETAFFNIMAENTLMAQLKSISFVNIQHVFL
jgi:hypothetical protein